ncbi:MAG: hypothetical protein ABL891_18695 [Burkholderiales bacterium]
MAITVTHGPSLRLPFAAVIGDFDVPAYPPTTAAEMAERFSQWLPMNICERLPAQGALDNLPYWVARVAQAITEARGSMNLPVNSGSRQRRGWVALSYYDAPATVRALQFSLSATLNALLHADSTVNTRLRAEAAVNMQLLRQPDSQARALMRVARARKMPVYPVAGGSLIWQYGQGRKAQHCYTSATQSDSTTGVLLQQDKMHSNALVRQLGLPGVEHGVAAWMQQALAFARQFGYPLVVKPLDSGGGRGVTVNVNNPDEVKTAFTYAMKWSRKRRVIVEKFVAGKDYRIMVAGGKFLWAIRRMPPEVVGDGASSMAALIEQKNARIPAADVENKFANRVAVDDELRRLLALQQMNLETCPPAGKVVQLRANANVATGGSFVDVSKDIHPDNREMAEVIARAFRLDSAGLDFLTTDIGRSWHEGSCAIIEVNATPGLVSDDQAEKLVDNLFARGDNGRIPSILLLCRSPVARHQLFAGLTNLPQGTGVLTRMEAQLNGCVRSFGKQSDAGTAAQALLLDPACDALVAICTANEVRQHGLPLDHFDVCAQVEDAEYDKALHELLNTSCDKAIKISAASVAETLRNLLLQAAEKPV